MKKLIKLAALPSLALLLSGCVHTADIVSQLKGDPATVVLNVGTVYGTVKFTRVGSTTNNITVSPDGTVSINPPK